MNEAAKPGAAERQATAGAEGGGPGAATRSAETPNATVTNESADASGTVGDRGSAKGSGAVAPRSWIALWDRVWSGWRRVVLSLGFVLQPVLLVCAALVLMQGWLGLIDRTYIVEARVTGARIVFAGRQSWRLEDALLCLPTERDLRTPTPTLTRCGPAHDPAEDGETGQPYAIDWPHNAAAVLRMDADQQLRIEAEAGPKRTEVDDLPPDAFMLVSPKGWRKSGALLFVGQATAGTAMGSGETGFLLDGRYEVRERSILTRPISDRSHLARSGPLTRGDRVEIVAKDQKEPTVTYGHLTMSGEDDEPGFHAVAVSGKGDHVLQIWFYGLTEPVRIRPSWIDSLGTNPLLVALVVVLALFANLTQLLRERAD